MEHMQKYIGTKVLMAMPMTLRAYYIYRVWDMPLDEDPHREGYLVEYEADADNPPNQPPHEGYVSWSPKAVFEKTYVLMSELKPDNNLQYHINPQDSGKPYTPEIRKEYEDYSDGMELYDNIARGVGALGTEGFVLTDWDGNEYPLFTQWLLDNVPPEYYHIVKISYSG